MVVQQPSGSLAPAIGVLVYSFLCAGFGLLTVWLVWVHRERSSYVFLLAVFTTVGTLASSAQQIHTIVWWKDIKLQQWRNSIRYAGQAELALSRGSVGLDLVLFYIQFICYGIQSLLIFLWSGALLQSAFQFRDTGTSADYRKLSNKLGAVLVPIFMVGLCQIPQVQNNGVLFYVLANSCVTIGLCGSVIMLIAIFGRYLYTKQLLLSFNFKYGNSSNQSGHLSRTSTISQYRPRSIYDRWLLLRFIVGFLSLGTFQVLTIASEIQAAHQLGPGKIGKTADLSTSRAIADAAGFIPGATPPLFAFVVFGTTRTFRDYLLVALTPKCLRGRFAATTDDGVLDLAPFQSVQLGSLHVSDVESGRRRDDVLSMSSEQNLTSTAWYKTASIGGTSSLGSRRASSMMPTSPLSPGFSGGAVTSTQLV